MLKNELMNLVNTHSQNEIIKQFKQRIDKSNFTRDENSESHFCVYFATFDPILKEFFIGHHKKASLWLFNGGHIDKGELILDTLRREIQEEWGLNLNNFKVKEPELLTITYINNIPIQTCRAHYDIWYFLEVNKNNFLPDNKKLHEEFHEVKWLEFEDIKKIIKDKNTILAVNTIIKKYF